jgi:hypothetical protein
VIIGCGRTGSLVAAALRRIGLQRLVLIDPDRLEPHNVGEMDVVTLADVDSTKTDALAGHLRYQPFQSGSVSQPTSVNTPLNCLRSIPESILSLRALIAIKQADFLVCCVDDAAARLMAATLAKLYLRPLLDLGTGIFGSDSRDREMGADVRLVLPDRSLLCFGGIARYNHALETLGSTALALPSTHDWREQRSGSLRSLNQLAVGLAMRLLEDLIGGRLQTSTWVHVDFSAEGIPAVEHRVPVINTSCQLCTLTARGDDGLAEVPPLMANLGRS